MHLKSFSRWNFIRMSAAGAGGGVVAKELSVAGLSVVLFERGGWAKFDEHNNDELRSQRTNPLSFLLQMEAFM